jgi:hypothetical protein
VKHHHKSAAKIKRVEPLPLPPSLEAAFAQIENLDAMHPSSRGQAFGAMIYPAGCCAKKTRTSGSRSNDFCR